MVWKREKERERGKETGDRINMVKRRRRQAEPGEKEAIWRNREPWEKTKDVRKNVKHSGRVNQTHIKSFPVRCVMNERVRSGNMPYAPRPNVGSTVDFPSPRLLRSYDASSVGSIKLDDSCVWSVWTRTLVAWCRRVTLFPLFPLFISHDTATVECDEMQLEDHFQVQLKLIGISHVRAESLKSSAQS